MSDGNIIKFRFKIIKIVLISLFIPICILMLYSALCSSYITVHSWNCNKFIRVIDVQTNITYLSHHRHKKCDTILDSLKSNILTEYLGVKRNALMVIRTLSLYNTLLTYSSGIFVTYKLTTLPLLWLGIVSTASFIVTINATAFVGPQSGIYKIRK